MIMVTTFIEINESYPHLSSRPFPREVRDNMDLYPIGDEKPCLCMQPMQLKVFGLCQQDPKSHLPPTPTEFVPSSCEV